MLGYPQMDKKFTERELNIIYELKDDYVVDFAACNKKTVMLSINRDFICSYGTESDAEYQIKIRNLLRSNQVHRFFRRIFEIKKKVLRNETLRVRELKKNIDMVGAHSTLGNKKFPKFREVGKMKSNRRIKN